MPASLRGVGLDFLPEQPQLEGSRTRPTGTSQRTRWAPFAIFGPGGFGGGGPYSMYFGGEALSSGDAWSMGAVDSACRNGGGGAGDRERDGGAGHIRRHVVGSWTRSTWGGSVQVDAAGLAGVLPRGSAWMPSR